MSAEPASERTLPTSGSSPGVRTLPSSVHVGEVIAGKYRLDRICGAGGMGVVVEARHLHLYQRIAIKFMSPAMKDDDRGVQRFMLEARAAARIQNEHVVRVLDVALLEDGTPYMVMEFLEGEDLGELLRARGRLPIREAVDYVLQAGEAIAEAHRAGIVHRDLKPGNLFLCRRADGSPLVKVLDFGVSKLLAHADMPPSEAPTTAEHVIIGSPPYSAPEQLRCPNDVDARTDIWALGVVLYQLVAGRAPFAAESFLDLCSQVMHAPVTPLSTARPDVTRGLNAVVARTLAKDRAQRFESLAELAEALAPFAPRASLLSVERIRRVLRGAGDPHSRAAEARPLRAAGRRGAPRTRATLCWAAAAGLAASIVVWASVTSMAGAAEQRTPGVPHQVAVDDRAACPRQCAAGLEQMGADASASPSQR